MEITHCSTRLFTVSDWDGINMLYLSLKSEISVKIVAVTPLVRREQTHANLLYLSQYSYCTKHLMIHVGSHLFGFLDKAEHNFIFWTIVHCDHTLLISFTKHVHLYLSTYHLSIYLKVKL